MSDKSSKPTPGFFAALLPELTIIAREHGYALAVHGSMARDLDLIAAPWIEEAAPAEALVEAMRERMHGYIVNEPAADPFDMTKHNPQRKPHGRLGWSIQLGRGVYIDVSVMPRQVPAVPA